MRDVFNALRDQWALGVNTGLCIAFFASIAQLCADKGQRGWTFFWLALAAVVWGASFWTSRVLARALTARSSAAKAGGDRDA
jgi:hypothetical protein